MTARTLFTPWLLCFAFGLPPGAGAEAETRLDPALLALCGSNDPGARRYCLEAIARNGDAAGDARQILAGMAASDPLVHEEAARLYQQLYGAKPPGPAPVTAARGPDAARSAGDPMRVVYAPTAFTRPEGTTSFNAFELGALTFDHGMTRNVAMGIQTSIPVGALVIGPTLRVGFPFEGGAFGFQLGGILVAPYVGNSNAFFVGGGGPMLTLGNYDRYFNVGALAYFVSNVSPGVVVPHVGFSSAPASMCASAPSSTFPP